MRPAHEIHFQPDAALVAGDAKHDHGTIGQLDLELPEVGPHHRAHYLTAAELRQRLGDLSQQLNRKVLSHVTT